jgi:hypothetical protein
LPLLQIVSQLFWAGAHGQACALQPLGQPARRFCSRTLRIRAWRGAEPERLGRVRAPAVRSSVQWGREGRTPWRLRRGVQRGWRHLPGAGTHATQPADRLRLRHALTASPRRPAGARPYPDPGARPRNRA